jgi:hypothetical protein
MPIGDDLGGRSRWPSALGSGICDRRSGCQSRGISRPTSATGPAGTSRIGSCDLELHQGCAVQSIRCRGIEGRLRATAFACANGCACGGQSWFCSQPSRVTCARGLTAQGRSSFAALARSAKNGWRERRQLRCTPDARAINWKSYRRTADSCLSSEEAWFFQRNSLGEQAARSADVAASGHGRRAVDLRRDLAGGSGVDTSFSGRRGSG